MGFFSNLFGKQTCCLCGAECGPMSRDKIKNKEYVCSDCKKKCSSFIRVSEMDKETVQGHIDFMEKRERIYQQILVNSKALSFFNMKKDQGIVFYDDHGFLVIVDKKHGVTKLNHEVIRYDEVESYELYTEMNKPTEQGKPETFKEDGVIIRLFGNKNSISGDSKNKGAHVYPYNTRDIKICLRTSEKQTQYADNVVQHFDHIFGVYDNRSALFSFGMNKQEKRELQAQVDMAKLMGGAIKAAVKGESAEGNDKLMEQMEKTQASTAAAETSGLSAYSAKADAAEQQAG
ncbi:MAG: hypothetical protein IKT14_06290 [Clostridiales bacterium]|nr:hypothetical protein [Clostridiales bacterium]